MVNPKNFILEQEINIANVRICRSNDEAARKSAMKRKATMLTAFGSASISISLLMQYSLQFSAFIGMAAPPVAVAIIAITGLLMLGLALNYYYRANQIVTEPRKTSSSSPNGVFNLFSHNNPSTIQTNDHFSEISPKRKAVITKRNLVFRPFVPFTSDPNVPKCRAVAD